MEIILTRAVFGMGNENHDHVHRYNTMNISSDGIDTMKVEHYQAGSVSEMTLNKLGEQFGGLTSRPLGVVGIEDGWNVRRGIGMLKFTVNSNALVTEELTVLGYLTGGGATHEGIESSTLFLPVRSWTTATRNVLDGEGLPTTRRVVDKSNQYIMGCPHQSKRMSSLRPSDIAQETLGYLAAEAEGVEANYAGLVNADLTKRPQSSKTLNLDPTHHAKSLLRLGQGVIEQNYHSPTTSDAIAEGLSNNSFLESTMQDNPFFLAMQNGLGSYVMSGFMGWSIEEINSIFVNLGDVLDLTLLNPTMFGNNNNLMLANSYGSASNHEIIASELAFLTVHLLTNSGLTHLTFSATNNPMYFQGLSGSDDGVAVLVGEAGSVFDNDEHLHIRVESFIERLKSKFFSKYNTGYSYNQTLLSVEVECSLFGETKVTIFFADDESDRRTYVNATYAINRTSSNIAPGDVGLTETKAYVTNLKEYFESE